MNMDDMTFLLFLSPGGSLLCSEGDLVEDELWDGMREGWGHGKEGGLGLETILVSDEGQRNSFTIDNVCVRANHGCTAFFGFLSGELEVNSVVYCKSHAVSTVIIRV